MDNLLIVIISFMSAIGIFFISHRYFNDYLAPIALYATAWFGLFGAYSLGWIAYVPVEASTWALLGSSLIGFLVGAMLPVLVAHQNRTLAKSTEVDWSARVRIGSFELGIVVIAALGFLGFYAYMVTVNDLYGLETFVTNPTAIRAGQDSAEFLSRFGSFQYILLHLNMLVAVLVGIYLSIFKRSERKLGIVLIGLFALFTTLFMLARTQFFVVVIWFFFLRLWLKPIRRFRVGTLARILLVMVILIAFFFGVAQSLGKTVLANPAISLRMPNELLPLADAYQYLTGTIPTFQAFTRDVSTYTWGTNSMLPVVKLLALFIPDIAIPSEITPNYFIPFPFNATTYLSVYYQDWGAVGVILIPSIIGFVSMRLYIRMKAKPTLWLVFLNSLIAYCLVYSVFNNRFITTYVWEFIIVGYLFIRSVSKPSP